jgi:Sec-independent protein translocase protein TatA
MLDLSPEKIMALMAIGLVVLGPHRLPGAARTFARGLARAQHLAKTLTQPVHDSLAEPRRSIEGVMAEMRGAIHAPTRTFTSTGHPGSPPPAPQVHRPAKTGRPEDAGYHDFDPASN